MTIRRRLAISFLIILLLFGVNLVIQIWSSRTRSASVEALRRAITRQVLVASINQNLNDRQKEVALLSQVTVEATISGASTEEVVQFKSRIDAVHNEIEELRELSEPATRDKVEALAKGFQELGSSWMVFYQNFGVHQAKAIMELAVRADPLSQKVLRQMLPQIQDDEKHLVDRAGENFKWVARVTDRVTILIFMLSTVVGTVVAYFLSRYLTRGLDQLEHGAALIGSGDLDHRISIQSRDELGDLAGTFNEMTGKLLSARKQLTEANEELEKRHQEVEKQRQLSESLLHNILPVQVAEELSVHGKVEPKYFEDVTILFTDFVGFTLSTEKLPAEDLVYVLHDYFTVFDQIINRYGLEKLKTIGDSYMCVGGLPARTPSHPVDAVMAALEMVNAVVKRDQPGSPARWAVRVGIHTGPVIAGVVGIQKFAFDIWGDTVNYASRMESSGAPNRINISERTYSRVKDFFECEHRGRVATKEKRELDMYFVKGALSSLVDGSMQIPPPAFLRRYRIYFQRDPLSFPAFLLETSPAANSVPP